MVSVNWTWYCHINHFYVYNSIFRNIIPLFNSYLRGSHVWSFLCLDASDDLSTKSTAPKWYSHGSAMANTMQQISASIGTAILVTLVAMGTKNASVIQGLSERQAQLTGFEWAFMGSTLLALF